MRAVSLPRKLLASLATIAASAGLMAFGTFGTFDNSDEPLPGSVVHVQAVAP